LPSIDRIQPAGFAQSGGILKARSSHDNHGHRTGSLTLSPAHSVPNRNAVSVDGLTGDSLRDREGVFSSALLASDKELANVVRRVDQITKALNLDAVDPQALQAAVRPVLSAVRHLMVGRELRYLLLTDDLTGLYNRRAFFAAATHQLKLASRNAQSMLLWFCDVDDLRQINDRFGHREGDLALARAGEALTSAFRDSDILARLGGDEFAVLAPAASSQHETSILERLKQTLQESAPSESRYELTLSVGVARFDAEHAVSLGELMEQADRDMYEQKRKRPSLVRPATNTRTIQRT
jgi:diguanylate cyclase (GGDEF)-like protein